MSKRRPTGLVLVALVACKHTSGEVTHEEGPPAALDALVETSVNTTVGADGELIVAFDVDAGTTAFALEGTLAEGGMLQLAGLFRPDDSVAIDCADWVPTTDHAMTDACWSYTPAILDFPIVPGQTIEAGTWTAVYVTEGAQGEQATMTLIERGADDDTLTDVYAQILLAEGLAAKFQDKSLYDPAIQHWTELWGAHDIVLHARWGTVDIGPGLSDGMDWRETPDAAGADGEMTIIFTKLKEPGVLGYVTAAPGPVLPSKDGVLVIDVPAHAGGNGKFESAELETLGETIAHEALHYTGLYHPVDGDAVPDQWDALDDTLECTDWETCDTELGANLMYWSTIYDENGNRVPQVDLTAGQRHVARHWAGAL